MSILNRASDGLFNMVTVLYNTLRHEGPMNRDKLLAMVAPASVSEDRKMASNSLNRWIDLGLFEESDGNVKLKTSEKGKSQHLCRLRCVGWCCLRTITGISGTPKAVPVPTLPAL